MRVRLTSNTSYSSEDVVNYSKNLTEFQQEKLSYMFHFFFDTDNNQLMEHSDIDRFIEKIKHHCGWDDEDERTKYLIDVTYSFWECLADQVKKEKAKASEDEAFSSWEEALAAPSYVEEKNIQVTEEQWLNTWGRLCKGAAGLSDFPIWVKLLVKIFFDTIDVKKDGVLSKEEYQRFYKEFCGVNEAKVEQISEAGWRAMTANGTYKLTLEHFGFCFSNFLLGRSIYGPGKYIFGVFGDAESDKPYQVVYNEE